MVSWSFCLVYATVFSFVWIALAFIIAQTGEKGQVNYSLPAFSRLLAEKSQTAIVFKTEDQRYISDWNCLIWSTGFICFSAISLYREKKHRERLLSIIWIVWDCSRAGLSFCRGNTGYIKVKTQFFLLIFSAGGQRRPEFQTVRRQRH